MSEQTRRRGGVLIEPLEPDDSDERCIIPTIHPHYIELPKLCTESISTKPQTCICLNFITIVTNHLVAFIQATAKEDEAQQIPFRIRE